MLYNTSEKHCRYIAYSFFRRENMAAAILMVIHASLIFHCAAVDFVTYDEIGNLTAGIVQLRDGEYGLFNVNPPISKMLSAVPLFLAGADTRSIEFTDIPGHRPELVIGERFAIANADRYHFLVLLARLPGIGWSLLGALVVYIWATKLWGWHGGILSLTIWCFEPNIIAHAHLVTADLPAAVAAIIAAYLYCHFLKCPCWASSVVAGVALGIAELSKFTLLTLTFVWAFVGFIWIIHGSWLVKDKFPLMRAISQIIVILIVSIFAINCGYEFSGSCKRLDDYLFVSRYMKSDCSVNEDTNTNNAGNRFSGTWIGRIVIPFPSAMIRGIDLQRYGMEQGETKPYYLAGQWKVGGWWYYYLYAAAVKIPIGALFLFAWGTARTCQMGRLIEWPDVVLLFLPAAVILGLAISQTSVQKHFRYVLPILPFGAIVSGAVAVKWHGLPSWNRLLIFAAAVASALSYLLAHPHSIAFFNEMAGGSNKGSHHLLGSNLEWGQDLWRLKQWLGEHIEVEKVHVAYCNAIDLKIFGIEYELPPLGLNTQNPIASDDLQLGPLPGYYAVSISLVMGQGASIPDGTGGKKLIPFGAYSYFQRFKPIDRVGKSIFIYRISHIEANEARAAMGMSLLHTR